MHKTRDTYGEINTEADMRRVFSEIRQDIGNADSRATLTELYLLVQTSTV